MEVEGNNTQVSRAEKSLAAGYWDYPLEPTSEEICGALRARGHVHYEDGYPENLVSLNRFFVMHKVGYRNGKGVKLEGWKTYDDHLMTKTSSGPLNGNENLVLRIFALRPVVKGIEPIKLCWVKELSKGHQSGRRKKFQPEAESGPNKRNKTNSNTAAMNKMITVSSISSPPPPHVQSDSPVSPNGNLMALYNAIPHQPKQEPHSPLSPISPLSSKFNTPSLPGLHITLAGLSGSLPPFMFPNPNSTTTPSSSVPISSLPSPSSPSSPQPSPSSLSSTTTTTTTTLLPQSSPSSPSSSSSSSSSTTVPLKSESSSPPPQAASRLHSWNAPSLPPASNTSFIIVPSSSSSSSYPSPTVSTFDPDTLSRSPPLVDTEGRNGKQRNSRDAPFAWKD